MWKIFCLIFVLSTFFAGAHLVSAALSCSVSNTCTSPDVIIFRLEDIDNSHTELPSENNYANLVCCSGVTGLSNSCSDTYEVVARLSGDTNAHIEENTEVTAAYDGHDACISVPSGGTVTIGYQNNSCTGFDTIVASISTALTNAHLGNAGAYLRKICASATPADEEEEEPAGGGGGVHDGGLGVEEPPYNPATGCRVADFNCDENVDLLDLSILLFYYQEQGGDITLYDLNESGKVDFPDISIVFYYWGNFA